MKISIYGLVDPRNNTIRYIGQAIDYNRRFSQHLSDSADTPKVKWISELKDSGLKPSIIILGECDESESHYLENWWILLGRRQGWMLTNGTNPGAWRVKDDFKTLFADELVLMYEDHALACARLNAEHKAACERLNSEVIALSVKVERDKWINRGCIIIHGVLSFFNLTGCVVIWNLPNTEPFAGWLISIFWLLILYVNWATYWIGRDMRCSFVDKARYAFMLFSLSVAVLPFGFAFFGGLSG